MSQSLTRIKWNRRVLAIGSIIAGLGLSFGLWWFDISSAEVAAVWGAAITLTFLAAVLTTVQEDGDRVIGELGRAVEKLQSVAEEIRFWREVKSEAKTAEHPLPRQLITKAIQACEEACKKYSTGNFTVYGASEVRRIGQILLREAKSNVFATVIDPRNQDLFLTAEGKALLKEEEEAVNRGVTITRVFIIDDAQVRESRSLVDAVRAHASHNVEVKIVRKVDVPSEFYKDFGLWDDRLVCVITERSEVASDAASAGTTPNISAAYSIAAADLGQYANIRKYLESKARPPNEVLPQIFGVGAEEANQQRAVAAELCPSEAESGHKSCRGYHGSWTLLRILDCVEHPSKMSQLFETRFHSYLEQQARRAHVHLQSIVGHPRTISGKGEKLRLLIAGLADAEMLRLCIETIRKTSFSANSLSIHVIDTCGTPLEMARRYAISAWDGEVTFCVCDAASVFLHQEDKSRVGSGFFDAILTDGLLTKVDAAKRLNIRNEWARILKIDGRVFTTVRVDSSDAGSGSPDHKADFVERVRSCAESQHGKDLKITVDDAVSAANEYSDSNKSFPFGADADVESLFSAQFERIESAPSYCEFRDFRPGRMRLLELRRVAEPGK